MKPKSPKPDPPRKSWPRSGLRQQEPVAADGNDPESTEYTLRQRLNFSRSAAGKDHPETVAAEVELGWFLISRGRAHEAVNMLRHAAVSAAHGSRAHTDVSRGEALFALAKALDKSGADIEAMDIYWLAYRSFSHTLGMAAPDTVISAFNLAETARVARDFESAERWFRVVLNATHDLDAPPSIYAAHALNNLAETLLATGRTDEAAQLADEGLAMRKALLGASSPEYWRSLCVAASISAARGDRVRLDGALQELRSLTPPGADLLLPLDLVVAYLETHGDYAQAVKACEATLANLEDTGQPHDDSSMPDQAIGIRFTLARLLLLLDRWSDATIRLMEAFELETMVLIEQAPHRSQRQMRLLMDESRHRVATMLDIISRAPDLEADGARKVYEIIQQRKSLETRLLTLQKESFITNRGLTVASPDSVEQVRVPLLETARALGSAREEWLSALLVQGGRQPTREESSALLALQDQVEYLERDLASFVGDRAYEWAVYGITSGTPPLPEGEAVVEFFYVEIPSPAYFAFVVAGGEVRLTKVGDAASIHQALTQLRVHIINEAPQYGHPDPPWRRRARFLANRLIKPLLPWLKDIGKLYIVPDGELFTLPFDLLPLDEGGLAIDCWTITHLWNGGEHAGFTFTLGTREPPGQPVVVSASTATPGAAPDMPCFAPLPFARREAVTIANRIGGLHLDGEAATKKAVVASLSPEILHFASHSFWIPRLLNADLTRPAGAETVLFRARSMIADPMLRSGIALAYADRELNTPTAASPGILFASEVLDLDLRDTDLVVLSSCQSGIGDPRPGDGIQGLRRAFRAAGASSVVSSLWKVPDNSTHDFMVEFYDRILAEVPRGEALRLAKLALRERYPDDPLSWAGFVLDGDDGPLSRFSPAPYTAAISLIGLSFDKAMEDIAAGRLEDALHSLQLVVESQGADHDLRAQAALKRAEVLRRLGRIDEALSACDSVIDDVDTPADWMRSAVRERALTRHVSGDLEGAMRDYTAALSDPAMPDEERAWVLVNRGCISGTVGDGESAIANYSEVLTLARALPKQRAQALLNRAEYQYRMNAVEGGIADATALAESPDYAGFSEQAMAHLLLALLRLKQGDLQSAKGALQEHLKLLGGSAPIEFARELSRSKTPEQLTALIIKLRKAIVGVGE